MVRPQPDKQQRADGVERGPAVRAGDERVGDVEDEGGEAGEDQQSPCWQQFGSGFARYGFRVPAVIVSPYAKPAYVSDTVYGHTSILAMVERKWNLPALTFRDANASGLNDFLDLDALAAGRPIFPRLPTLAAPGNTPGALACSTSGPGTIPPLRLHHRLDGTMTGR